VPRGARFCRSTDPTSTSATSSGRIADVPAGGGAEANVQVVLVFVDSVQNGAVRVTSSSARYVAGVPDTP
jgi:hypothetical protein